MIKRFAVMGEREAHVAADACALASKAAKRVRHHADPRHLAAVAFAELESAFREVERGEAIMLALATGHDGPRRVKWNQDLMNAIAAWVKDNPPPMLVGLVNGESPDTLQETPKAKARIDAACKGCSCPESMCRPLWETARKCCPACSHVAAQPAEPAPLPRSERSNSSDELRSESSHKSPK